MKTMTFKQAAGKILQQSGTPLHAHEIARRALEAGLVSSSGKTPNATMEATLCVAVRGKDSPFVRVSPRTFGLKSQQAGAVDAASDRESGGEPQERIHIPHLPSWRAARGFLKAIEGRTSSQVFHLRGTLKKLRGTPQSNMDWTDPDTWITERLSGEDRETAQAIWVGSDRIVNPRHNTGVWFLTRNYGLLQEGSDGRLSITERGHTFIKETEGEIARELDEVEGLLAVLRLVAESGPASSGELLEPWGEHLHQNSRIRSDSATRSFLYYRLTNLMDRKLVSRSGQQYAITPAGLDWLGAIEDGEPDPSAEILSLVQRTQEQVKEAMRELLADIDPYAFEHLIKELLVAMGYDEVEVTSPSNDKGVDVVGRIELGITSVKEVVQVKRHRRTIQRKDLDALRGCLHRFQAVRGTIIATSRFSSGTQKAAFEIGAAPITLIDGDKLIELLAKHEIGVNKRKVEIWELDEAAFESFEELNGEDS
jgi:restriction system protein